MTALPVFPVVPATSDPLIAAAVADALDAETQAVDANREARAAAWTAARTAAKGEDATYAFQETTAWAVAATAWAEAAETAARKSGQHHLAVGAADGAEQARAFAMGHVRLAAKAAGR